jgi:hypothetical protein
MIFLEYHKSLPILLVTLSLWFSEVTAQSFPPPKPLTEEEQIRLVITDLEQSLRSRNMLRLLSCFADPLQYGENGDSTADRHQLRGFFQQVFAQAENRWNDSLFQLLTPPGNNLSPTWDFHIDIDTVRILNAHTAQVKTRVYFAAAAPDSTGDWHFGRKHRENIDGEWRTKKVKKFLRVVHYFGNND